ncbi:MAG: G8 domain-containing protein [Nitrospirota bacterium]
MANYVSTQSGDWNNPATWGGSGYPQLAGDTCTISAGHTVTYNVQSAVELGQITVNGILKASRAVSTKLTLGHAEILINNGGEMDWGKVTDKIPTSVVAEILWNTTGDNSKGINVADGGKLSIYGDPAYYGSTRRTVLYADWTSGQSFQVVGDLTGKWAAGHIIYVHKGAAYASSTTDITNPLTINTVTYDGTKSTVTINEAFPGDTYRAGGIVLNVSRNVKLGKLNPQTNIGQTNSNRPRINDGNTDINHNNVNIYEALLTGFHSLVHTYNLKFNAVMRNGGYALANFSIDARNASIDGIFISNSFGVYIHNTSTISGIFVSHVRSLDNLQNCIIQNAEVLSSSTGALGWYTINNKIIDSYFYANYAAYPSVSSFNYMKGGALGYSPEGFSMPNTYDSNFQQQTKHFLSNVKLPAAGLSLNFRNNSGLKARVFSEHHNQVKDAVYQYDAFADLIKNTSTLRTGGASSSIEAVPLSNCSTINDVMLFEWYEENVPAMQHTRSIYMKGEGWSGFPLHTELYFEAEYLDQASGVHTAKAQSTTVLANNIDWTEFPVTFTPAQSGCVIYRAYLKKYQAAAKVYVDTQLNRLGMPAKRAVWSQGECRLMVSNYDDVGFNMPLETVDISSQYEVIEL